MKIKFNGIKRMADIPNQVGFSLYVFTIGGGKLPACVTRDDNGCHMLDITRNGSVKYSDLVGWTSF